MILALALALDAHAGAWTREQGDAYVKVAVEHFRSPGAVDPLGGPIVVRPYRSVRAELYGELGLLRRWPVQLSAAAPFVVGTAIVTEPLTGRASPTTAARLGDARAALQARLPVPLPMAIALEAKVPMYANGRLDLDDPRPGDGQLDGTCWWLVGGAIPRTSLWGEAALGYRHRTEWFVGWDPGDVALVDGIPFRVGVGARAGAVAPMASIDGLRTVRADELTAQRVGAAAALSVDTGREVALEARVAVDLWARNTGRGASGGVGLSWRPRQSTHVAADTVTYTKSPT